MSSCPVWDTQTVSKQTKDYSGHIYEHFQCLRISEFANGLGFVSDSYQEKQSMCVRGLKEKERQIYASDWIRMKKSNDLTEMILRYRSREGPKVSLWDKLRQSSERQHRNGTRTATWESALQMSLASFCPINKFCNFILYPIKSKPWGHCRNIFGEVFMCVYACVCSCRCT